MNLKIDIQIDVIDFFEKYNDEESFIEKKLFYNKDVLDFAFNNLLNERLQESIICFIFNHENSEKKVLEELKNRFNKLSIKEFIVFFDYGYFAGNYDFKQLMKYIDLDYNEILNTASNEDIENLKESIGGDELQTEYFLRFIYPNEKIDKGYFSYNEHKFLLENSDRIYKFLLKIAKTLENEEDFNKFLSLVEFDAPYASMSVHNSDIKRIKYLQGIFENLNSFHDKFLEEFPETEDEDKILRYNIMVQEESAYIKKKMEEFPNYFHN